MSFFPRNKMPLTQKENPLNENSGSANASDYNRNDEELRAIEDTMMGESLVPVSVSMPGVVSPNSVTDADEDELLNTGKTKNLLGLVARLVAKTNLLMERGLLSNSGYAQSGQRITFPEVAQCTFLTVIPTKSDAVVTVGSTVGFPDNGVISILNDVQQVKLKTSAPGIYDQVSLGGAGMVEWIRYTSKTATQFLGCTRGYLGTMIGTHNGNYLKPDVSSQVTKNVRDYCVKLPNNKVSCARRYPGLRYAKTYFWPTLGLIGSFVEVVKQFRINAPLTTISAATLGADEFALMQELADDAGVLRTRLDGSVYLESSDTAYVAKAQLRWEEALPIVQGMLDENFVTLVKDENDIVAPPLAIPVFGGRMGVQVYAAAASLQDSNTLKNIELTQTADGRLYMNSIKLPGEGATSSTTTTTTIPSTSTQIDYLTQVPDYRWTWSQSSYSGYITVSSVNSRRTKIGDPITYETTDKYEYAQMFTVDNDVTLQKVSLPLAIPLAYTLAYNPDVLNLLLTNYSLTINVMRSETLAGRTYPTPSDVVLESFNVKLRDIKVQTSLGNESVTPFVQEFPCSVALPKGTYFITMAIKEQYGGFGKSANVLIPALLEQVSGDVGLQTSLYTIANGSPAYPYTDPAFWAVSDPTRLFAPSTTTLPTFNVRGQAAILLDFNSPPKAATTVTSTSSTSTPAARFAQGVVGYQTFFVASPRTIQEKDRN